MDKKTLSAIRFLQAESCTTAQSRVVTHVKLCFSFPFYFREPKIEKIKQYQYIYSVICIVATAVKSGLRVLEDKFSNFENSGSQFF
jgi:hypothetical protein